jgi:hypothetical protein
MQGSECLAREREWERKRNRGRGAEAISREAVCLVFHLNHKPPLCPRPQLQSPSPPPPPPSPPSPPPPQMPTPAQYLPILPPSSRPSLESRSLDRKLQLLPHGISCSIKHKYQHRMRMCQYYVYIIYIEREGEILKYRRERYRTIHKKIYILKWEQGLLLCISIELFLYSIFVLLFLCCYYYIIIVIYYYFRK